MIKGELLHIDLPHTAQQATVAKAGNATILHCCDFVEVIELTVA